MGKGRSYEIIEYRKLIMQQIVENEELRKLLDEDTFPLILKKQFPLIKLILMNMFLKQLKRQISL